MTRVLNRPERFHEEMLAGFADVNARYARAVHGGVVRSLPAPPDKVAVVIGGGSGHYPSFVGLVGAGLADGAAVGGVFASPSTDRIVHVARAAHHGAGVVLTFGNYTGDVLNFSMARDRLIADGIPTRLVAVTDDIASAPLVDSEKRRGIAGDLVVFKAAGAAAEAGYDLEGVERIARQTNARTRSLGVAFAGCTLPGSDGPLFTVPAGLMSVGMGIHGEPGIAEEPTTTAEALGRLLVERLLAERSEETDGRAAVILNGLGATKYEELFVLWATVARDLRANGVTIIEPEVGELITSLDMAGCSLTICWLNDEIERLWRAPTETAAYRKSARLHHAATTAEPAVREKKSATRLQQGPDPAAAGIVGVLQEVMSTLRDNEGRLGALDAIAGDGDHGVGMLRGATAAHAAATRTAGEGAGSRTVLEAAADAWGDEGGGTSGALWGVGLRAWASELVDGAAPTQTAVTRGAQAALAAIIAVGGAQQGDKTLLDALIPFVDVLGTGEKDGDDLPTAWCTAAAAATNGALATADLSPQVGRARPLAARSLGHPDPGAVSLALCVTAVAPLLRCGRANGI